MNRAATTAALGLIAVLGYVPAQAATLSGAVASEDGVPAPFTFVGLLGPDFGGVGHAVTDLEGAFSADAAGAVEYLVVQPPTRDGAEGHKVFALQPRIYKIDDAAESLDLRLPHAATFVLEAYDAAGRLMRWEDFMQHGSHGGQFLYAVNADDEAVPFTTWPVHGRLTGADEGERERGLPGVLARPGERIGVNLLFWPTTGYGKLLLPMDNAGAGYQLDAPGAARLLLVNLELARSAVAALERRAEAYAKAGLEEADGAIAALAGRLREAEGAADSPERAKRADAVLAEALRLRDELELARARAEIPRARQGELIVTLENAPGGDLAAYRVEVAQQEHDFLFGAFEGSPYNADAFEAARKAGFNLATVLLGWNWTQSPTAKRTQIESTFGIQALADLGYRVKAHGVLWLQEYGILPDRAMSMEHGALREAKLRHQETLLEMYAEPITFWEAMNEPANTNVVGMARDGVLGMIPKAAAAIRAHRRPTLVNSPHEFDYGAKFMIRRPDGAPMDDYALTYSAFLSLLESRHGLDDIDIIGLQMYPGFRLSEDLFAGQEGPAYPPAAVQDTLDRYARFGKTLHITEFSLPGTFDPDWKSGYWRERWTESTQADYAEAAFTIAFAHPSVQSFGWWDITDLKPSVIQGGLVRADGTPKPVFERLTGLIADWTTQAEAAPGEDGRAAFRVFGGEHRVRVTGPDGGVTERTARVLEGWRKELIIDLAEAP